jgi:hypothetical protein
VDDEFLNYLLGNESNRRKIIEEKYSKSDVEILRRLNDIESMLRQVIKSVGSSDRRLTENSLCEQVLEKGFVILEGHGINKNLHPSLFVLPLDEGRILVTFKDTIDLLIALFEKFGENVETNIPKRLLPLFSFLRRSGLIYYNHVSRRYELIK